MLTEVDNNS